MHFLHYTQTVQFNSNHFLHASFGFSWSFYHQTHACVQMEKHIQVEENAQYDPK